MLEKLLTLDRSAFLALNGPMGEFADSFFYFVSGNSSWIPLYLLMLYFVYRKGGWKTALVFLAFVAISVTLADQMCNIAKYGLKKLRPSHEPALEGLVHTVRGYIGGYYGTFSAHAATMICIATFTARFFRKAWVTIFMSVWALVICYSRIYLGLHYPLDPVCGGLTGFIFGWYAYKLFASERVAKWYKS